MNQRYLEVCNSFGKCVKLSLCAVCDFLFMTERKQHTAHEFGDLSPPAEMSYTRKTSRTQEGKKNKKKSDFLNKTWKHMGTGRPSVTVIALSMAAYVSKPLQIAVQKKKKKRRFV